MPLYFFHLKDGEDVLIDAEGMELRDIDDAKATALLQARDIISHEALKGHINLAQWIEVRNEAGAPVCSIKFEDAVHIHR
jgi:hypothetical protein